MMRRRYPALLLTVLTLLFALAGCSVSSSSSSTVTTSVTNSDGETTTTTTSTENGVTTTDTTVTQDPTGLRATWHDLFFEGAEGVSDDTGECVYFAYDDMDALSYGAVMILNQEQTELLNYDLGDVYETEDGYIIEDVEGETEMPFALSDFDDDGFVMTFNDGDAVYMHYTDQETIIDDMISIWEAVEPAE